MSNMRWSICILYTWGCPNLHSIVCPKTNHKKCTSVSIGNYTSALTNMTCGVPQGSILGPLLCNIYMLPLAQIMKNNDLSYHSYADDTQMYITISPGEYSPITTLSKCIEHVNDWMSKNILQLDKNKTENCFWSKGGTNKSNRRASVGRLQNNK